MKCFQILANQTQENGIILVHPGQSFSLALKITFSNLEKPILKILLWWICLWLTL